MLISKIIDYFYLISQKLLEIISDFFSIFYLRFSIIIIVGVNAFIWLAAFIIRATASEDLIILHYNIDFGVNLIGDTNRIYTIPFLGLIIIFINVVLLIKFNKTNEFRKDFIFPSYLLLAGVFSANMFLLIAIVSVYLINFR